MVQNSESISLSSEIDYLREKLNCLITKYEGNLLHPEIIELSQKLDKLLLLHCKHNI